MIVCRAYAKLNLCLAVSPPEPPGAARAGWHRIASWFAPINLWDDVVVERATGDSTYHREWAADAPRPTPIDWPEEKDLAVRAHRLLEQVTGRPLPIRLRLSKRIPTGGGLGGGSSDAAAVLRSVAAPYELPVSSTALRQHSARLGSDVAYFIPGAASLESLAEPPGPALVSGFGDEITAVRHAGGAISLIVPQFGCDTPAVYRAFDSLGPQELRYDEVARLCRFDAPARLLAESDLSLFNDLTPAAEVVQPCLKDVRRALESAGHHVHMSGSGSTLFVISEVECALPWAAW